MANQELGYDENALAGDLRAWWNDRIGDDDPFAKEKPSTGTIFDALPPMDSLSAVTGLVTVEHHLGFEVPPNIIRRGGYASVDDLLNDIVPKARALAEKHKASPNKGKKKEAA